MSIETILRIEDLSVKYRKQIIINNISLNIDKGKIYSIIGSNGCGKTTLMRAVSRSIKPKSGQVFLDGEDIFGMKPKNIAKKVAVLYQSNNSFSDIEVKNLVMYGRYSHKEWWKAFGEEDTKIVEWAIKKTGLLALKNRKINTLSGGERQRTWIAMCIAQKPKILLLDEPTTYLDISHQLEIMELISRLNKEEGITILMVLHDINHAVRYSDELIVLKDHKIYQKGDPCKLIKSSVLEEVFNVKAELLEDRETKRPIFYAKNVI